MSRFRMVLLFLVAGLLCLGIAGFLYFSQPPAEVVAVASDVLSATAIPEKGLSQKEQNLEKGRLFEEYMLGRVMGLSGTTLVGRNADYSKNGVHAEENSQPDLRFRKEGKPFAVECKWRRDFFKDRLDWAGDFQIRNYNDFQRDQKMPVFIARGVGGTPEAPRELYLVSLARLKYGTATRAYLQPFLCADDAAFEERISSNL